MNDTQELLFLVARDFVQLSTLQQVNIGLKLKLVTVEATLWEPAKVAETIFSKAYQQKCIPALVQEMRTRLYE